MTDLNSLLL